MRLASNPLRDRSDVPWPASSAGGAPAAVGPVGLAALDIVVVVVVVAALKQPKPLS
jgi:hypothetical protein